MHHQNQTTIHTNKLEKKIQAWQEITILAHREINELMEMEHEGDSCPSKAFNPNKIENKLKAMKKRNNSVPNDSNKLVKKLKLHIRKKNLLRNFLQS